MPREISWIQKTMSYNFIYMQCVQKRHIYRDRKQISGCQELREGKRRSDGWGVSFWGYENVLSWLWWWFHNSQFSSVAQSCPTLCDPMNRSTPGLPVHHQLLESTQTHVHRVDDAIQPSHPPSSPSPPVLNFSQQQGLFQWVITLHILKHTHTHKTIELYSLNGWIIWCVNNISIKPLKKETKLCPSHRYSKMIVVNNYKRLPRASQASAHYALCSSPLQAFCRVWVILFCGSRLRTRLIRYAVNRRIKSKNRHREETTKGPHRAPPGGRRSLHHFR